MSGGCARKLDHLALSRLLEDAAREGGSQEPLFELRLSDAVEVALAPRSDSVVASVDLLYVFGSDLRRFGAISAVHALSDIYASLSRPRFGMLALGLRANDLTSGRAASLIQGVGSTLKREGAVFAGGHTAMANETFASLSVVGDAPKARSTGRPSNGDILLLSKPLGSGLAITALQLGAATEDKLSSAYEAMLRSNRLAADLVTATLDQQPGSVSGVTDVSGFGFLNAIAHITDGCEVHVEMSAVPTFAGTEEWLMQQATSSLTDANVVMTEQFTSYELASGLGRAKAILNDPQTSGGLAVAATPAGSTILESSGHFARVGRIDAPGVGSRIIVV